MKTGTKDCLGNKITNFVAKTFRDGELKALDLHKWMETNVFLAKTLAVRVYEGTEVLTHTGTDHRNKDVVTTQTVKKHIGWNLVAA